MNNAPNAGSRSRSIGGFAAAILAVGVIAGVIALELLLFPSLRFWNKPVDEFQQGIEAYRKLDYDGAIRHFSAVIAVQPKNDSAFNWRGMVYRSKGDNDQALADFDTAVRLNPSSAGIHYNRGIVHVAKRDFVAALADYSDAIRINPAYAMAYNNRANVYQGKGDIDQALADYGAAVRIDPTNALFVANRGFAYRTQGDFARAIEDYEGALRLAPDEPDAFNSLAWLWSTCPQAAFRDGKRAIEYATKGCELTKWKNPALIDTLAAAYAESEAFEEAARWQAYCLGMPNLPANDGVGARERLALYQAGKPYREEK